MRRRHFMLSSSLVIAASTGLAQAGRATAASASDARSFVGKTYVVKYGDFLTAVNVFHEDGRTLSYKVTSGPLKGAAATVTYEVADLGNGRFLFSWQESDKGTVTRLDDFTNGTTQSYYTSPKLELHRISGSISVPASSDAGVSQ